ncbi:MAG: PAS domain S-box protein, partial [Desulfobacteraceae bacterium]|nr:PAS domain S-box protein [Desulfobacteraceae bacterium]
MKNTVIFFLITLVLFCILVMSSIFAIAIHDIDKVQQQSEKRIIRSVLQENKKDVAAICHEYAWWDKAYNNLVENYNRGWIASNIGSYLIENQDITCSFVISGSTNTIYSNIGGKEKKVDLFEISHGGLKQLLRDARDCPLDRPEPVRGYLEVNDKLYFVGATAITPYTWKAGPSISPRSVLVLAREMDKDFLERLSAEYNIGSPALESRTGDDPTGAQIPLYGTNEVQLGSLTWSPRLPSGMFVREILPYAVLALAVIALITWLIISRLTQITREMSANRNFLRDVTDSLPGALYQFQMNSRGEMDFNYMSRGFLEMAELNSDEDLTDSNMIFGLVVPEDLDGLYNSIRESYKGMLPWSHDFRIQTKSGVKWIFGSSMPRNHVSDIIVWNGVLVDITVTKEKQALEKDYREMVENQSELICRWLPDTTLTFVNLAYADFFGVDAQEVLGKKWIEFLPEHEKSGDLTGIYSLTPQEPVNENENYAQRKDGAWRWLAWTNKAFFDDQGAITHVLGVGRDLTEQRRAEEELRRSHESLEKRVEVRTSELKFANEHLAEEIREKEEYARELQETNEMYKLLTENMFDVIWKARITPDGSWQFIYRSPSVQNLLGYTPDEAMANPFQCLASWSYDDLLNTVSENCDRLF